MASNVDAMALRQSIEVSNGRQHKNSSTPAMSIEMPPEQRMEQDKHLEAAAAGEPPFQDNCDGKHDGNDSSISISSTSKVAGQNVAPFLAKHIPEQYAPLGTSSLPATTSRKDPNTKYCYRHRPDSKCRKTADEPTMENLQRVC